MKPGIPRTMVFILVLLASLDQPAAARDLAPHYAGHASTSPPALPRLAFDNLDATTVPVCEGCPAIPGGLGPVPVVLDPSQQSGTACPGSNVSYHLTVTGRGLSELPVHYDSAWSVGGVTVVAGIGDDIARPLDMTVHIPWVDP